MNFTDWNKLKTEAAKIILKDGGDYQSFAGVSLAFQRLALRLKNSENNSHDEAAAFHLWKNKHQKSSAANFAEYPSVYEALKGKEILQKKKTHLFPLNKDEHYHLDVEAISRHDILTCKTELIIGYEVKQLQGESNGQYLLRIMKGPRNVTSYQGKAMCVGHFRCTKCKRIWTSNSSFANSSQMCEKCRTFAYPFRQYRTNGSDDKNKEKSEEEKLDDFVANSAFRNETEMQNVFKIFGFTE